MKKIISIVLFVLLGFTSTFASSGEINQSWAITNPEISKTSYIYYWGNWCPHCAVVNSYMKWVDAENKIDIKKRETWKDRENAVLYTQDIERLGLKIEETGVPFLIINENWVEKTLWGSSDIINYFKPILWEPVPSKSKPIVLWILALFLVAVPLLLIFGWKKK